MHAGAVWFWPVVAALIAVTAALTFAVPPRRRIAVLSCWFMAPAMAYCGVAASEIIARPLDPAHTLTNYVLGFSLLSAVLIVPWVIVLAVGFAVGLGLRGALARAAPTSR